MVITLYRNVFESLERAKGCWWSLFVGSVVLTNLVDLGKKGKVVAVKAMAKEILTTYTTYPAKSAARWRLD
jgi:hypothetical protein